MKKKMCIDDKISLLKKVNIILNVTGMVLLVIYGYYFVNKIQSIVSLSLSLITLLVYSIWFICTLCERVLTQKLYKEYL